MSDKALSATAAEEATNKVSLAEVYPNPSSKTFRLYLSLNGQQSVSIQLYSVEGKKLVEKNVANSQGIVDIDASAYKPGVYFVNVKQGTFNKTIKVIRKQF
jgi:hypothetical protein